MQIEYPPENPYKSERIETLKTKSQFPKERANPRNSKQSGSSREKSEKPTVFQMLDIRDLLDRHPTRQAFGWWPLIEADGDIWEMEIYIVRLPYNMCFVSAYQSRVASTRPFQPSGGPSISFVWSRFAYHRGLNMAIGNARIKGDWIGGWEQRTARWDQLRYLVDPLMISTFPGMQNIILQKDVPFRTRIDPQNPYSEREQIEHWGRRIREAVMIHIWRDFVHVRRVVKIQRAWRRRRLVREFTQRLTGTPATIQILSEMCTTGAISRDKYRELLQAYIHTCVRPGSLTC